MYYTSNGDYGVVAISETAKTQKRKYENQIPADPFNLQGFARDASLLSTLRVGVRADAWKRMGNDRKLRNDFLCCPAA